MRVTIFVVLASLIGACQKEPSPTPPPKLPKPAHLPGEARKLLSARMIRHHQDLHTLMNAIVMLDRPRIVTHAERIANEPRFARTNMQDANLLNDRLPPEFFVHQDALRDKAKMLAASAHQDSDEGLAKQYSELASSCVGCHATYLKTDAPKLPTKTEQAPAEP